MDIHKVESLKKKIEEHNNKVLKIEARKELIAKNVVSILKSYGFHDLKDYKKLLELKEEKTLEIENMVKKLEAELEEGQLQLSEIEKIISL